jgi:hypothetical protein
MSPEVTRQIFGDHGVELNETGLLKYVFLQPTDTDIGRNVNFKWGGIASDKTPKCTIAFLRHGVWLFAEGAVGASRVMVSRSVKVLRNVKKGRKGAVGLEWIVVGHRDQLKVGTFGV